MSFEISIAGSSAWRVIFLADIQQVADGTNSSIFSEASNRTIMPSV